VSDTGLSVTVLGCSGTYAAPGGACSGYLLRSTTTSIWLDCGSGTLGNLQRHVSLVDLDGIVVSHSHPDHWLELPVVLNALRYGFDEPRRDLPVLWTAKTADLFHAVVGRDPRPTLAPRVVDQRSTATIGDIELRFSRTDHPVETLAVRAECEGRSIVYSADTGDGWRLASLGPDIGRSIDLAIVEATLDESDAGAVQHLTASQAGRQATEAGVASLLLTHLAPGSDAAARRADAARAYGGPIAVAEIDATHEARGAST
jgi:ribonuclease BN (tRNA processing enzyme)